MRIKGVGLTRVAGPISIENARQRWQTRTGLLLELVDEAGRVGQGECSPLPGYSPDSLADCERALRDLGPMVVSELGPAESQVVTLLSKLPKTVPAARFALETAVLDLLGQRTDRSMVELLSGETPPISTKSAAVLITEPTPGLGVLVVRRLVDDGFRTVKLKIGRSEFSDDLGMIEALRSEFGDRIEIRLDANGQLGADGVESKLRLLSKYRPELIEEPCGLEAMMEMTESEVPLALDESLQGAEGWDVLERLVSRGICRAVVLKPMVLGGLFHCLGCARRASGLGIDAIVSHLFDGPVAYAAYSALALAQPRSSFAAGLGPHPGLSVWPKAALRHLDGARIGWNRRPGLGMERLTSIRRAS